MFNVYSLHKVGLHVSEKEYKSKTCSHSPLVPQNKTTHVSCIAICVKVFLSFAFRCSFVFVHSLIIKLCAVHFFFSRSCASSSECILYIGLSIIIFFFFVHICSIQFETYIHIYVQWVSIYFLYSSNGENLLRYLIVCA